MDRRNTAVTMINQNSAHCPNCGNVIPTGTFLCPNCGWEAPGETWPPAIAHPKPMQVVRPSKLKTAGLALLGVVAGLATSAALSLVFGIGIIVGPIIALVMLGRDKSAFNWGFLGGSVVPFLAIVGLFVSCAMSGMRR